MHAGLLRALLIRGRSSTYVIYGINGVLLFALVVDMYARLALTDWISRAAITRVGLFKRRKCKSEGQKLCLER